MKTYIIGTLTVLTSLSAFAQNRGNGQVYGPTIPSGTVIISTSGSSGNRGGQPQLPKKVVDCVNALRQVVPANDWDLENRCRSDKTQKDAQTKLDDIRSCVQTGRQLSRNFWAINCLDDYQRAKFADSGYTNCVMQLKGSQFEFNDDQFCQDKDLRALAGDLSLNNCVRFFDKDLSRAYGMQAVAVCKDQGVRQSVSSKLYRDCHEDLKKYNAPIEEAISYCGQPQQKVTEGLGRIRTCISEMSKIFGNGKGMEVCVRNINLPEIASRENISCMNNTLRSASPSFTDLLRGSEAAQFMRDLTLDCKKGSISFSNQTLRYLNTFFIGNQEKSNNQEIGGLSGLAWDAQSSRLLAVSDQRFQQKNYIFKFELKDIGQGFDVIPEDRYITIKPEFNDGKYLSRFDIDAEGLVIEPATGNYIVSSESLLNNDRSYIKVFGQNGRQIEAIELPQKFYNFKLETLTYQEQSFDNRGRDDFGNDDNGGPVRIHRGGDVTCYGSCGGSFSKGFTESSDDRGAAPQPKTKSYVQRTMINNQGVSENKGFESLGLTRDGKTLFTANEAPLRQDRANNMRIVRILKLERSPNFKAVAEYMYNLEDEVDNGLVDILPLSATELLTLERSYDSQKKKITARIFRVNLSRAVDTLANESLFAKGFKAQPVKKELVLDLDSVINSMPAGLRKLDNLEGMALGPKTSHGNDTLLIVSDNNMSAGQRTMVMSFELMK